MDDEVQHSEGGATKNMPKPMTETKRLSSGAKVTAYMMNRLAGLEVKKRVEKLCESYFLKWIGPPS